GCGGYMMVHDRVWSDFVLALDFKISPGCNSGVFVRTFPLTPRPGKDVGYNGIEVAIDDTRTAGYHDTGALYDLVRPSANVMKPAGEWNHLEVTCDGPRIAVALNGRTVTATNLDEWTAPNRRRPPPTARAARKGPPPAASPPPSKPPAPLAGQRTSGCARSRRARPARRRKAAPVESASAGARAGARERCLVRGRPGRVRRRALG